MSYTTLCTTETPRYNLTVGESATFSPVGAGQNYAINTHYVWTFTIEDGVYMIHFNFFSTERGYDYLTIGSGFVPKRNKDRWRDYHGTNVPADVAIVAENLYFLFLSDSSVRMPGFEIVVSIIGKSMKC